MTFSAQTKMTAAKNAGTRMGGTSQARIARHPLKIVDEALARRTQLGMREGSPDLALTASPRWKLLALLSTFAVRRLGMLACVLRVLLGLGGVLLALGMVVLAVRFGNGTMGLCCGFVRFRRLVVRVFHVVSLVVRQISAGAKAH
jgi:hypothetical protein